MFFARTVAIALMFSVIFSQIAHSYHPALDERLSLIPIAMLLGFGGDDMPRLLAAIWKKLISLVNSRKDQ